MGIGLFFVGKSAIMVFISDKTQDKIQDKIIEHIGEIMNTLHFKYAVEVEQTRSKMMMPRLSSNSLIALLKLGCAI